MSNEDMCPLEQIRNKLWKYQIVGELGMWVSFSEELKVIWLYYDLKPTQDLGNW